MSDGDVTYYSDPNARQVAGTTATGAVTTAFWGESGRPGPDPRDDVPGYLDTDETFDEVTLARAAEIVARYPQSRSAVMPLLHLCQAVEGFVSANAIAFVADQIGVAASEVNGVATFYSMYKREPVGEHIVGVCTNSLCAALGGDTIYTALCDELGVGHEETAGDPGRPGSVTLEHVECLAGCDLGPVVTVDYEFFDNQTPESAVDLVRALRHGERPTPTRGAALKNFKDAELDLTGVLDDLEADVDAPSAAPETMRGARLAEDRGWHAPALPDTPPAFPDVPEKK
jgi:NADH-quinone oxidoreductase subunit E